MRKYIAGNIIEDIATFTTDDNITPIDPTAVHLTYAVRFANALSGPYTITFTGSTTPATGQIAKTSAGTYTVRLDTSLLPGYWQYQWFGTGTAQANIPSSAIVHPSPLS